ncbi:MAG: hypothetical protein CMM93_04465 [Rickettsiales bacterium]|nr:hypothetical protein [Rickettsiales bacterium]|tara:strand:+ start:126 stop:515 length:390 start_codon:yes stop_codon:yes gene_type:complete
MSKERPRYANDRELWQRAKADQARGLTEMAENRIMQDIGPTFDAAWHKLRHGKPTLFFAKTGGAALGAGIAADGIFNIISGLGEEREDIFLPQQFNGSNLTRIATGAGELIGGAALTYFALTKGPMLGK